MINIIVKHNNGYSWRTNNTVFVKGFIFDLNGNIIKDEKLLEYFSNIEDAATFEKRLSEANGQFAVIIRQGDNILAATDIVRTFPLFYKKTDDKILISDDIESIIEDKKKIVIDEESKLSFRATGYVTGNKTLVADIKQVEAGEYITFIGNKLVHTFYHTFIQENEKKSYDEAKSELRAILARVGARLATLLDGCPVAVPLSGGLDSRLILHLLHSNGYASVKCFTYGSKKNNPELQRARKAAETYGYEWLFIDYDLYRKTPFADTELYENYVKYASQYSSKFYFSEYFAAEYLKKEIKLPDNTVIIPGHSGDSISGSHLRPYMRKYHNINTIAKDIQYSQYNLIRISRKEQKKCTKNIADQLSRSKCSDYRAFENWIMKERQTKYIVNSCRMWEFRDYKFVLPLWDKELVDFFMRLPFEQRLYQKLYKDVVRDLFAEQGLWFSEDEKQHEADFIQSLKVLIKRFIPMLRKNKDIFTGDHYGFREITMPLLKSVSNPEIIQSYNGIFTEWYIENIDK